MSTVRPEDPRDAAAVRRVYKHAFETAAEADLVDALRARGKLVVSLVAESVGDIAGHIAFSRVRLASRPELRGVALGPMAVLPAMQRRGIGSALVREGVAHCREAGWQFAVVVGHPTYYPRFEFVSASRFGLGCSWQVPDEVFMALELSPGALARQGGLVTYEPEFGEL